MPRYRQPETRWIGAACVAGAYLVCVAILFTLQIGASVDVPISLAVSAPPLVYAALSMVLLRQASFVRRLSWLGGACLVHVLLGVLAATELMWAGGLSLAAALAQAFVLFAPAPAVTLVATPLALATFGLRSPRPTPRAESPAPRPAPVAPVAPAARPKPFASAPRASKGGAEAAMAAQAPAPRVSPPRLTAAAAMPTPPAARAAMSPITTPPAPAAAPASVVVTAPAPAPTVAVVAAQRSARVAEGSRPDDGMVRVSFNHIAAQLPAEAFVLPFDRLGESLKEPHVVLVPRRVVLSRMRADGIAITWANIASQFPDLALGMSDDDFRKQYPDLKLSLPVEEVLPQLPAGSMLVASAVPEPNGLEMAPVPGLPVSNGQSIRAATDAAPVEPAPAVAEIARAVAMAAAVAPPAPHGPPPVPVVAPPSVVEVVDRETVGRIVTCFSGVGSFEAARERVAGTTLVTLVEPSLARQAVTACAAQLVHFLAGASGELVTVRTSNAVLVLAAAPMPIVVAARRPGAPVALLELRAARAAAVVSDGALMTASLPSRALEPVAIDGRVARAAQALTSFGAVEPTVFADGGARAYVFSARGADVTRLAALALGVCHALADNPDLGRLISVVFRRGAEHTLVRPLARAGATLVATGPVTRPGRVMRDADRAATVLEAL